MMTGWLVSGIVYGGSSFGQVPQWPIDKHLSRGDKRQSHDVFELVKWVDK